jgi:signal transduction histidine kinase
MNHFDEMKSWVSFTPADEARLQALLVHVRPALPAIADLFYERILAHPSAASVLRDDAQVERLKGTLQRWAGELLSGPWDCAYYNRRERIGRVHVEVGLPARYMFTAMHVVREALCKLAIEHLGESNARPTCESIARVTDMDLAIMTGTYVESREEMQIVTLQEVIVSHMPVTVLLLDDNGNVTAATRPSTRLFGDVPATGRPYVEALPPALVAASELPTHVEHALTSRREVALPRVDVAIGGQERNFRLSIVPLDHPRARTLIHVEELTEAIATEGRLLRSESLAQLGALSAAVAHELRNPLAGISGAIQVISRSLPSDDRRKPIMEKVEQQVRRLDALVTDLLDFARPTTARMGPVKLEDVTRSVVENVQRQHAGVAIKAEGASTVYADPNLVHQILLNLILNAVQAVGGEGQVLVLIASGCVRVSDSGPGVAAENADKIFQPFFTTRTRGTGLGLAICRKAANAMAGRLELGAGPLAGACFVLELPPITE